MSSASGQLNAETIRAIVRITLFAAICWITWRLTPLLMPPQINPLVVSTLSSFTAGALANGLLARMYEGSRLSAFGMAWRKSSARELLTGLAAGAGAAVAILLFALVTRMAHVEFLSASSSPSPSSPASRLIDVAFVLLVLAFGAVGEELMFRGYGFQLMVRTMGEFAAVLPVAVLFGVAHMGNRDVTALAIFNTVAWGILLGYAFLLTRALWLPIGLHYGWNAAMPLLGANLSGFTMEERGYAVRWSVSDFWSGGAYGFEGSMMTTVVVIGLFFILRRVISAREEDLEATAES